MYHTDWLMRQIQMTTQVIARLVFNKDAPAYEIVEAERQTAADGLYTRLQVLLNSGRINEAENLLFSEIDETDLKYLMLAIDFYAELNKLSEEELERCDFSHEEIAEGLAQMKRMFAVTL